MNKKLYSAIILFSLLMIGLGVGCLPFSYYFTPGRLDRDAQRYTIDAGVAEPNDYAGYQNLAKLDLLQRNIDKAYAINQQKLNQLAEQNDLKYNIYKDTVAIDKDNAMQLEEFYFGQKGLLSFGLSALGLGSLTGVLGLMRKRPGDITREDYQKALAEATGKTAEELSAKEKQFIELVKSIDKFKTEAGKLSIGKEALALLKTVCNDKQDSATQIEVAKVLKSV